MNCVIDMVRIIRTCGGPSLHTLPNHPSLPPTLLLAGMAMSTWRRGESLSQKAITGMFTKDASRMGWWSMRGSVTMSRRGSRNCFVIWLVKVPGV